MSREDFIEAHRHEIGGWILDAATVCRTGADLSLAMRNAMKRIDARLGAMYEQLQAVEAAKPKPETAAPNGKPQTQPPATTPAQRRT